MIHFKCRPDDADMFEVEATTRDILTWERTNRGKTMAKLLEDQSITDMYALAFIAARRQRLWTATVREFEEFVDLDFSESEPVDPTPPAQ